MFNNLQQKRIFDKLTTYYKRSLVLAYQLSTAKHKQQVESDDLLMALLQQKGSLGYEALVKTGIKISPVKKMIKTDQLKVERDIFKENQINLSARIKKIIVASVALAAHYEHNYIGTEHLLYSLIKLRDDKINKILRGYKIQPQKIMYDLKTILNSTAKFSQMAEAINAFKEKNNQTNNHSLKNKNSVLDFFGTELTAKQVQKKINPVIGRGQEIERIIQILCRRDKNNPILLGEPGVGKTAIIEGLAKKILQGEVPDMLLNKRIYALDMPLLVAGTAYRGEFEARIKQIVDEAKNDRNIILFIDEIHNIMGAGSTTGTMDAANILKPALARGEIRCIGATTFNDYKKYIEQDSALSRRLQKVKVDEPTPKESIEILKGIKRAYEQHHAIQITDEAIEEAVKLSVKYLTEQYLPDKAIDLIDEAASQKRLQQPSDIKNQKIAHRQKNLFELNEEKKKLIAQGKYNDALRLKSKEVELINQIYQLEEQQIKDKIRFRQQNNKQRRITAEDIKKVLAASTKIPISDEDKSIEIINNLSRGLKEKIVGQNQVIAQMLQTLKRSAIGLAGNQRPLGSFIFAGPSGVGKTYTAKMLAQLISPPQKALIKIDMSEYSEKFNSSKMIGAPAGYIGYDEGGQLTEKVKQHPYSVILLDEIEKAHPDIFNLFLQILEDGYLTDSKGHRVNFKNTIIIMTTNIGLKSGKQKINLGFGGEGQKELENIFKERLSEWLKPEFLNRVDEILVFKQLGTAELKRIINLELKEMNEKLKDQAISVSWDKTVINYLFKKCQQPDQGARVVREILRQEIENQLADKILKWPNKKMRQRAIKIIVKNKKLNFV